MSRFASVVVSLRRVIASLGTRDADAAAAGAVAYTLVLTLFTKLVRAALLMQTTHSLLPWLVLPLAWGFDLALCALVGLAAHALYRVRFAWLRIGIAGLLLTLLVLVHVFDIGAYELTGAPLTFQRLHGDEGGTMADLGLVARRDLLLGVVAIVVLCALIWPVTRRAQRLRFFQCAADLRVLAAALLLGWVGGFVAEHYLRLSLGLETQSAITLVSSIFDNDSYESRPLSAAEWTRVLAPGQQVVEQGPPPLPTRRPKNVVVLLAEGIAWKHTGFDTTDQPNPTPHLTQRVLRQGMVFSRYYSHWHASNQAIFSVACGSLPPLGGDMMRTKPRIDCGEFSQTMHDRGLHAGLFHGGQFSFYNKLALLGRRNYEVELDADELMRGNNKWQRMRWGTDDRAMVEATLKWVDGLPKNERFAALLISIAPHYPFDLPRSWPLRPFSGPGELPRYLNGVDYIDDVFEQLIHGFEVRHLAEDTLFVFLGDHGIQENEPPRITPGRRTFYEASLHVPLVMVNSRLFSLRLPESARRSNRVGGHEDLLPTLLDMMGDPPDPRHHGQSLFRDAGWPRRTFFGAMNGRYIGFVEGDHKFAYEPRAHQTEYYDLHSDPDELRDLSDKYPERMHQYSHDAMAIARGLNAQLSAAPVLNEKLTMAQLYSRFRRNVIATLEREGKATPCTPNAAGDNRACPGVNPLFEQQDRYIMDEPRRCLLVRVPEGATIRLRVQDPVTLSLLTSTVATVSRDDSSDTLFHVATTVDGQWFLPASVRPRQPEYVDHARGHDYVQYSISREHKGEPSQLCLQFDRTYKP